jgi:tryptophanyl-tRNA synthetase
MPTRVFTGLKPTGRLQLGNYLGAIRPLLGLAADPGNDVLVSIVDLHALTVDHDPVRLRELTIELAATLLACGLDPSVPLFVQSAVPAHTELGYLLECTATYGEMTRMIQFKEKSRQHLELATTLARRFNGRYGEVFTVPRAVTPPSVARIKDLRRPTEKMGKSGADGSGVLFLLDDPDTLVAKVRRGVTDSDSVLGFDPATRPGVANLAVLLGAFTGTPPERALEGLHGAGSLKNAVADVLVESLSPIQKAYRDLMADPSTMLASLRVGAETVGSIASDTVSRARQAMGLLG